MSPGPASPGTQGARSEEPDLVTMTAAAATWAQGPVPKEPPGRQAVLPRAGPRRAPPTRARRPPPPAPPRLRCGPVLPRGPSGGRHRPPPTPAMRLTGQRPSSATSERGRGGAGLGSGGPDVSPESLPQDPSRAPVPPPPPHQPQVPPSTWGGCRSQREGPPAGGKGRVKDSDPKAKGRAARGPPGLSPPVPQGCADPPLPPDPAAPPTPSTFGATPQPLRQPEGPSPRGSALAFALGRLSSPGKPRAHCTRPPTSCRQDSRGRCTEGGNLGRRQWGLAPVQVCLTAGSRLRTPETMGFTDDCSSRTAWMLPAARSPAGPGPPRTEDR